jgi:hypothetical protein
MRSLQRCSGPVMIAGISIGVFTLNASADERMRGFKVGSNIRHITGADSGTSAPSAAPLAAQGDCEFPPPENPLTIWCATNELNETEIPNTTICAFADANDPDEGTRVADDFFFLADTEIRGITWWGLFARPEGGDFPECDLAYLPTSDDNWTVRYFMDDNGQPGTLIREFVGLNPAVTTGTYTRTLIDDVLIGTEVGLFGKFEMTYTFDVADRFQLNGFETYWVEIYSDFANECFFCWETASPNWDLYSLTATFADPYDPTNDPDQINEFDMAQCQDVCFLEAVPNPPGVRLEFVDSTPVDEEECCTFRYIVENRNSPGAGPVTKFYMAVHRGDDDKADCGEDLSEITPPVGYAVSYCEGWRTRAGADNSDWVIYEFDPVGGEIPELGEVFGSLRIRVNDHEPNDLEGDLPEDIVPAFGIRAWGSQHAYGDTFCGSGENFDPLLPNQDEFGQAIWSDGSDGLCANDDGEPLRPIPASTAIGKGLLAIFFIGAGVWLVTRARAPMAT